MYTIPARFADDDRAAIEHAARARGITVAELIRDALASYIDRTLTDVSRWPSRHYPRAVEISTNS